MKGIVVCLVVALFPIMGHCQAKFLDLLSQLYAKPDQIYAFYINDQPDSIYAHASTELTSKVTRDQFCQQMQVVSRQLGTPTNVGMWKVTDQAPHKIYQRQLTFASFQTDLTIVLDSEQKVVGFLFANPQPLANTQATSASNEQEIIIQADNAPQLPGRLSLSVSRESQKREKVPVVILVHGSGPNDMNESIGGNMPFKDLADGLSQRGIAVIRYDKRTKVAPQWFATEGHPVNYDTETVDDALAAIRLAKTLPEIDPARIYVLGHSLGAQLAPRIAERSGEVRGLILLAGNTRKMKEAIREQLTYLGVPADSLDAKVEQLMAPLTQEYLDFDEAYSPLTTAARLTLPMLILQGERDYQVTIADFARWKQTLAGRANVTTKSYPSLNHLFFTGEGKCLPQEYMLPGQHVAPEVIDDIARFVLP